MNLTYKDKGDFLRALIILIGKDKVINANERKVVLDIGLKLGFEKKFCSQAIDEYLSNNYIEQAPPKFSTPEIAKYFLDEAFIVAKVDKDLHYAELKWLSEIANVNNIEKDWFVKKFTEFSAPYEELNNSN